ncbi:hypothetical protein SB781_38965, partial [Paraburkholderia sp. SIMBA_061]
DAFAGHGTGHDSGEGSIIGYRAGAARATKVALAGGGRHVLVMVAAFTMSGYDLAHVPAAR